MRISRNALPFLVICHVSLVAPSALACLGPSFEQTIFFEQRDLAIGIDGSAIAEVTITDLSAKGDHLVGLARVERVIKGPIDSSIIKVLVVPTSCTTGFGIGARGIVVGTLQRDAQGVLELTPITETAADRQTRRGSEKARQRKGARDRGDVSLS